MADTLSKALVLVFPPSCPLAPEIPCETIGGLKRKLRATSLRTYLSSHGQFIEEISHQIATTTTRGCSLFRSFFFLLFLHGLRVFHTGGRF